MPVSCYLCIFLNVGLGEGSALPVGVPVPWPSATPPTGWLKCNGAAFSAEEYPELAKAYPTNKLPDLRGEFIRGWDDGRGVDVGRAIGSHQLDALQQHTHTIATRAQNNGGNAVARGEGGSWGAPSTEQVNTDARTAAETRPRNVALLAIIKI